MTSTQFSALFVFALAASVLLQLWLAARQINHVRRHRNAVPDAFAGSIVLTSHQRAADYTVEKTRFGMVHTVFEAMVLAAFTLGGGIEWLTQAAQHWFGQGIAAGVAMIAFVAIVQTVLSLPFSWHSTFGIEAKYGFNQSTPGIFWGDLLKTAGIAAVLGLPLVTFVLWLMQQMGAHWWLWVWITWMAFSLFVMWVFPTWIAPLFNKFEPLPDESLRLRIEALLTRCGFVASGIFMMDGSKRSSHGNAYFTGLGKSKRIVFFDTLLKQLDGDEIEAVLAHELGHFKRRHIIKRIGFTFVLMLGLLWLLGQLMQVSWFYQGLGVQTQTTATALMLFFMVLPVFTFLFAPLGSWLSRKHEFEADAYAAEQASASDLINALVKLYRDNASTLTPDPLHSVYYDSHPPASLRVAALKRLA
ncbi:M48 family metallopeptidase [Silvimonas iriomotensis]|uniref:Peptidase n=1 Tax=Silvimonas iriomotensis TaxID=449662 RepID=A0ABQ2P8Z1_9NEIS|nr:M48 family metallopeptidase [Silvimonas iriomotensis]GGP20915.1 peptidase [Silvimonas iriomotensis]